MPMTHDMSLTVRQALKHYQSYLEDAIANGVKGGFFENEALPSTKAAITYFCSLEHINEVLGK